MHSNGTPAGEPVPIAVIGMSFQLPGDASSAESLWSMLVEGRCASREFPADRLNGAALYNPDRSRGDSLPLRGGHFINEKLGAFDAPFFSISAAEAVGMDPQSRALLETTYRALENAGIPMEKICNSNTSVYTGNLADDYKFYTSQDIEENTKYQLMGMTGLLSGRISWFFDLKGPNFTIDTACSSSLVALDVGCQSLCSKSADMSIVTGCSLLFSPNFFHMLNNMGMLSPDSTSFSFDHRANGYGRGEGIAALILKRLPDALRDGDTIRGVIRSTAVNHDGRTPGATQPNKESQSKLIRDTYAKAGLSMRPTRYFEAHGTGTPVGDPIEASAIGEAFSHDLSQEDPLYIGSIKANIGHTEGASGLASVIKSILILERGLIPPVANFEQLNPRIDAAELKIRVPSNLVAWPSDGLRRISVNSFGASGTNAHVVLDDAYHYLKERGLQGYHVTRKTPPRLHQLSTEDEATEDQLASNSDSGYGTPESVCGELKTPRLLIFSAPDKPALQRIAELYDHWSAKYSPALKNTPEVLERLAYTLAERRSLFTYRSFAVVDDPGELRDIKSQLRSVTRAINQPRMCFVFTGQGAQWSGMGMELLRFPIFRNSVRDADAYLKSIGSEWSSLDALCDSDDAASIHRPIFSQTLCTVLQVGLVDLCRSLGLHPAAVVGHSSGEIGAAYCAGAISKSSALKLAYFRGVVAERESKRSCGGMMAVGMSHKGIAALLAEMPDRCPTLAVACINSPENVTISGPRTELEALDIALEKRDVFHRRLKVDVAYHSSGLQVAAAEYEEYVGSLEPGDGGWPTAIMVSSVSGDIANAQDLRTVCYWVQNMLQPVRFCDALTLLCGASGVVKSPTPRLNMLIEVGPHGALQGPIRDTLKVQPGVDGITYHSAMRRFTPGDHSFLSLLGQVWSHGVELDLSLANSLDREQVDRRKRVMTDLPEYPFDHSRTYLHTGRLGKEFRFRRNIKHDLLGKPVLDWNPLEPRWRNFLKLSQLPWARDHKINGAVIYPAVGMLVMAIEAANQLADQNRPVKGIKLTDCVFSTALTIPTDAAGIETQLTLRPLRGDSDRTSLSWEFRVCSCKDGQWQEHSHGKVHLDLDSPEEAHQAERLKQAQDAHRRVEASARLRRSKDEFYDSAFKSGYTFGPTFRAMEDLIFSDESGPQTIANVRPFIWEEVDGANYFQPHIVHPTTLDGILQISLASFSRAGEDVVPTAIPTEIEYLWISTSGLSYLDNDVVQTRGTFIHKGLIGYETAVTALDKSSTRIVLEARGIKLRFVTGSSAVEQQARDDHQCYTLQWKPDPDLLDPRILEDVDTGVRIGVLDQHQAKLHKVLVAYLDLSTFKRPDMEILHIINPEERALGTLLHQLLATAERADSILPCAKFTSKDLNPDVADLPTEESEFIYPEAYDLIILSCTRNSIDLVPSIQRLLKAGGKVIVAANEESAVCRNLTTHSEVGDVWSETLESNGFSDTTVLYENSIDDATLIVSSKAAQGSSADAEPMRYRVVLESTPYQEEFALSLKVAFQKAGLVCDTRHIDDIEVELDSSEVVYIFLSELEGPFLEGISKENFMRLRHILVASRRLLWLTGRAEGGLPSPSRAMCEGLTRVLRVENENSVIVTASLEKEYISALVHDVLHLAKATELSTSHGYEVAYRKVGGHFQISRLTVAKDTTQLMAAKAVPFQSKIQPFGAGPPLRMAIETPGLLDSLHFVEDQSVAEPLAPDEVEIKVAMVGLNFKDLLLALGRENGTTFGNECAGIISRAGAATSFTPGDRVCTFTATAFSSLTRVKAERVARIPDSITLAHAAAVPTQFATCWHALYEIGNLKKDESILIHSAAGGTGQVAIQMAKLIGAEIFATVGSDEKKRFLVEHYGISEDHVFNSRSSAFADGILQMTNGYGIDVILNSLSGDSLLASWNLIAPYGRFIELGKKDILANTNLPMRPFSRRATFSAIETGTMSAEFGAKGRDIIERILRMLADGILQPVKNFDVLPISQVQEGMRMLQAGNYYGKIVFDMADDAQVPTRIKTTSEWSFDPSKTYVIAGGTGGLGRAIASWMVKEKGARNLLLLSRSGMGAAGAEETVKELREYGGIIEAPSCDICDRSALHSTLERYRDTMPRIGGCIQSSMVLRDSIFANMSYKDWRACTDVKTIGSWNLHTLLPEHLDFFVMLSSIAGVIGSAGQANYAAANTYMDALAHYRNARGQRAAALDLGVMLDHGVLADNTALRDRILAQGLLAGISSTEFFALLDHYCNPVRAIEKPEDVQLALGLAPPSQVYARGILGSHASLSLPFYSHIFNSKAAQVAQDTEAGSSEDQRRQAFVYADTLTEAGAIVSQALIERLISMSPGLQDRVDVNALDEPMRKFGIDSLLAIELRSWFSKSFAADVPIFEILGDETLGSLGVKAAQKSALRHMSVMEEKE